MIILSTKATVLVVYQIETLQSREYLVLKYADGILRIPADSLDTLSRYRHTAKGRPELHRMGGKTWEKTKAKVRKSVKKLAVDLLKIYAQRAEMKGITYPSDAPGNRKWRILSRTKQPQTN